VPDFSLDRLARFGNGSAVTVKQADAHRYRTDIQVFFLDHIYSIENFIGSDHRLSCLKPKGPVTGSMG
jgi:hypothetical protein